MDQPTADTPADMVTITRDTSGIPLGIAVDWTRMPTSPTAVELASILDELDRARDTLWTGIIAELDRREAGDRR